MNLNMSHVSTTQNQQQLTPNSSRDHHIPDRQKDFVMRKSVSGFRKEMSREQILLGVGSQNGPLKVPKIWMFLTNALRLQRHQCQCSLPRRHKEAHRNKNASVNLRSQGSTSAPTVAVHVPSPVCYRNTYAPILEKGLTLVHHAVFPLRLKVTFTSTESHTHTR